MKIIKYKNFDQEIILEKERKFHIIIEKPSFLRQFIYSLNEQILGEETFLYYFDNNKEINISKFSLIIPDILNINIDDKKTSTLIQKQLSSKLSQENKEEYQLLILKINEYITKLTLDYSLQLDFDHELQLSTLLKTISLTYAIDTTSFLEKIFKEIKLLNQLFNISLFFFINIYDYLDFEEMNLFTEEMNRLELDYVLISGHQPKNQLSNEFSIIIDEDLCELHIENKP